MSPGLMPRPSLSVGDLEASPQDADEVSPGLMPRPSLSGGHRRPLRRRLRARVAGVDAPAFVERRPRRESVHGSSRVAGVDAPAFVERGDGRCDPASLDVSPGLMPRPSLSVEDDHRGVLSEGDVSPGLMPRPSLSVTTRAADAF